LQVTGKHVRVGVLPQGQVPDGSGLVVTDIGGGHQVADHNQGVAADTRRGGVDVSGIDRGDQERNRHPGQDQPPAMAPAGDMPGSGAPSLIPADADVPAHDTVGGGTTTAIGSVFTQSVVTH
jgi:hypothetical protein